MKKFLSLLIALCLTKISPGQSFIQETDSANILIIKVNQSITPKIIHQIDSFNTVLRTTNQNTEKVILLNALAKVYWLNGRCDTSIYYAQSALKLAEKINAKEDIATAYNNMGAARMEQSNYPEALRNYLIALKIQVEIDDKPDMARSYINMGNVYVNQANYPEALKKYLDALRIAEEINSAGFQANAYEGIGNVYSQQGNYPDALKNYLFSLKIRQEGKDQHGMSLSYVNLGDVYAKLGNYTAALKNYFSVLDIEKKMTDFRIICYTYGSIGNVYLHQGKYQEALKNYHIALEMQEQVNDNYGIADSYINMGKIFFYKSNNTVAKANLEKGLLLAKQSRSMDEMKEAYFMLSEADSAIGNFKDAYGYHLLYSEIKDSILNEQSNKQINQLKIEYETDKKDEQIKTQELQNKVLQTRIYYGIAIGLIIVLFLYLRNERKKKEYKNKTIDLELKALKSQLSPHFIFNAMTSIKVYMDSNPQTGGEYLTHFSLFIRGVLESSEEKEISLGEEMQLMEHYLELEKLCFSGSLNYRVAYDESIDKDEIMIPPLITQPVIENAIWHGIVPKEGTRELNIHHSIKGNALVIVVSNNAERKVADQLVAPKKKSFGLKITRERLRLLKQITGKEGTLELEMSPGGTRVTITIPLKEIYA